MHSSLAIRHKDQDNSAANVNSSSFSSYSSTSSQRLLSRSQRRGSRTRCTSGARKEPSLGPLSNELKVSPRCNAKVQRGVPRAARAYLRQTRIGPSTHACARAGCRRSPPLRALVHLKPAPRLPQTIYLTYPTNTSARATARKVVYTSGLWSACLPHAARRHRHERMNG